MTTTMPATAPATPEQYTDAAALAALIRAALHIHIARWDAPASYRYGLCDWCEDEPQGPALMEWTWNTASTACCPAPSCVDKVAESLRAVPLEQITLEYPTSLVRAA